MAGSYNHAVAEDGQLLQPKHFRQMVDSLGDAYETVEEMYGMIWYLAGGDTALVEEARREYRAGMESSPGTEGVLNEE